MGRCSVTGPWFRISTGGVIIIIMIIIIEGSTGGGSSASAARAGCQLSVGHGQRSPVMRDTGQQSEPETSETTLFDSPRT